MEFAVHHGEELADDGDAKARSFDVAVTLLLYSLERLEKLAQILILDSDTGILNLKAELGIAVGYSVISHTQSNAAALRVLDRIGKKVHYDLRDPYIVAVKP